MTVLTPLNSPSPQAQQNLSAGERLMMELVAIQARGDLEAAKATAELLSAGGLRDLREWIDSRLAGGEQPEAKTDRYLSEREARVLQLIALGHSNKEIASQMRLSVKTVETYKARAMEKLELRTRVQLVRYAIGQGWFKTA